MTIEVKADANAEDVLIAWKPDRWNRDWIGFALKRRADATGVSITIPNRIPPQPSQGPVQPAGVPLDQSPIRRCLWTDHSVPPKEWVSYKVTSMLADGQGFEPDGGAASAWSYVEAITGDAGEGLTASFNRGTLMSQVVSHFMDGETTSRALHDFARRMDARMDPRQGTRLLDPVNPPRVATAATVAARLRHRTGGAYQILRPSAVRARRCPSGGRRS